MSEFVTKIHLFDSLYQQKWDSIDVNMNIDLPTYIDDDRPQCQIVTSYELKGRSINHLRQVEAQYALIHPTPGVQRTGLSWLLAPPMMGIGSWMPPPIPGFGSVPFGLYPPTLPPAPPPTAAVAMQSLMNSGWSILKAKHSDPWNMGLEEPSASEPECHCDIRMLMSAEHPAGCPWMIWKKGQKK